MQRFREWLEWTGWSQATAAEKLGCKQSHISYLHRGERLPGRMLANAIERESAAWPPGPIKSEEWDEIERSRLADEAEPMPQAS